jgi:adenylate cyclase
MVRRLWSCEKILIGHPTSVGTKVKLRIKNVDKPNMDSSIRVLIPIAVKLIVVTIVILLAAAVPIAYESSKMFYKISSERESDISAELAAARLSEVEAVITGHLKSTRLVSSLLMNPSSNPEERRSLLDFAFYQNSDFVSIDVWELKEDGPKLFERLVNEEYLFGEYELRSDYIDLIRRERENEINIPAIFSGQATVINSSLSGKVPLFTVGVPVLVNDEGKITHIAIADLKLDRLQGAFSSQGTRTVFLLDKTGRVLSHPDDKKAAEGASLAEDPYVKRILDPASASKAGQLTFEEGDEIYVGAFSRGLLGLTVLSQAPVSVITEPARVVTRNAYKITGYALSLSIFFVFVFSLSLSAPLERLLDVTKEVAKGNLEVKARIKSRDEVGALAGAFDSMVDGLKERDKVKNVLNKFHGSSVASDILSGDLQLGGSRKDVVVFFSDIRGFTKFSEGHEPEVVVEMLNEYFSIMVGIVTRHHGVVDKFVGDAMMAVWGAPHSSGRDEHSALLACLEMRQALHALNKSREERGLVPIMMGMGLHAGSAISGTIGSAERMEYTVIGDTVNMASRIEAATKSFGTDFLISDVLAEKLKDDFIFDLAGTAEVKGKSEPLKFYKVNGYYDEQKNPVVIETPYSRYQADSDEKIKIAV